MTQSDFSEQREPNIAKSTEKEMLLSDKLKLQEIQKQLAGMSLQEINSEGIVSFLKVIDEILKEILKIRKDIKIGRIFKLKDGIYENITDASQELNIALTFISRLKEGKEMREVESIKEVNRSLINCQKFIEEAIKLLDISLVPLSVNTPEQQISKKQYDESLPLIRKYREEIVTAGEFLRKALEMFSGAGYIFPAQFDRVFISVNNLNGSARRLYGLLDSETFQEPEKYDLRRNLMIVEEESGNILPYLLDEKSDRYQITKHLRELLLTIEDILLYIDRIIK